jgi:hypothetical protein
MSPLPYPAILNPLLVTTIGLLLNGCGSTRASSEPVIEFSRVPAAAEGTPDKLEPIEGRATGVLPGQRLVLYALSGVWWVQPAAEQPFTVIQADSRWKSSTHPGVEYAALVVDNRYRPPLTVNALPEKGGPVLAVATVKGAPPNYSPATLQFSGYQWEARRTVSNRDNSWNLYDPANAWTDKNGFLHLKVSRQEGHWVSADLKLSRSLGYGSYRFVVEDVSHLEPAAVFGMFTWDDFGPSREMDIEISRWGEPEDKNGQFVVQPWVVSANTVRFNTPPGTLTYWMDWQPGRVSFKMVRGSSSDKEMRALAEHAFTSGVPVVGNERIRINLYVYENNRNPMQHESEVVLEKFEYLP